MTFFQLPVDLQVCILKTWLTGPNDERYFLQSLMCLDSACCNQCVRNQLLELLSNPHIWRTQPCQLGMNEYDHKDYSCCLRWLVARNASPRVLGIGQRNLQALQEMRDVGKSFTLLSVESIELTTQFEVEDASCLAIAFAACPNATSIISITSICDTTPALWRALSAVPLKLKVLHASHGRDGGCLREALMSCGQALQQLHIPMISESDLTATSIPQLCPCLQKLEIGPWSYILSLSRCERLSDLRLRCTFLSADDIHTLLDCAPQLRKFQMFQCRLKYNDFADILERYPSLQRVEMGDFLLDRATAYLSVSVRSIDIGHLNRIVDACGPIRDLNVLLNINVPSNIACLDLLADRLGGELESVRMVANIRLPVDGAVDAKPLYMFPTRCPWLRKLNVLEFGISDENLVQLSACKRLEHLSVRGCGHIHTVTDAGMGALFSNCSLLKFVELSTCWDLTAAVLDLILDHRLKLDKLIVEDFQGSEAIPKFREQAKEMQLLPLSFVGLALVDRFSCP